MVQRAAVITGGTSGIGLATAALLLERGWGVAVTGSTDRSVDAAGAELGPGALVLRADARDLADADRVAARARERFGALHGIVLNAGISRPARVEEVDEALFDELFTVNARGQFFAFQRLLPLLVDGGSVAFTVGTGVIRGRAGASVTAGSRGALLGMVPALAIELAPRSIRVNAVSPGAIDTPIWAGAGAERRAAAAAGIPFGRLGRPGEIAETIAFLLSEGASYITGQHLVVGGGIDVA